MADNTALASVVQQAQGRVLDPDPKGRYLHRFEIAGRRSPKTGLAQLYTVSYDTAKHRWVCGCPGNIAHGHCKHLDPMLTALHRALPDPAKPQGPAPRQVLAGPSR